MPRRLLYVGQAAVIRNGGDMAARILQGDFHAFRGAYLIVHISVEVQDQSRGAALHPVAGDAKRADIRLGLRVSRRVRVVIGQRHGLGTAMDDLGLHEVLLPLEVGVGIPDRSTIVGVLPAVDPRVEHPIRPVVVVVLETLDADEGNRGE